MRFQPIYGLLFIAALGLACQREQKTPEAVAKPRPHLSGVTPFKLQKAVNVAPDFFYVHTVGDVQKGGVTKARLRVAPNEARQFHVALIDDCIDCAGKMWKATVRIAAALAANSLGQSLLDHEFDLSVRGQIDGPSGGALLAATFMAILSGQQDEATLRERLKIVGMTGGLNPDGTIMPVGGIPQKLLAAAEEHKEIFCYPYGQRHADNANSKEKEDIQKLAEQKHIKVIEIGDLSEAYHCLTGVELQPTQAVLATEMNDPFDGMRGVATHWLNDAFAILKDLPQNRFGTPALFEQAAAASAEYRRADAHLVQSQMVPLGYEEALDATSMLQGVRQVTILRSLCADPKLTPVQRAARILEELNKVLGVTKRWDDFYQRLVSGEPRYVEDAIHLVQAHMWLARAQVAIARQNEVLPTRPAQSPTAPKSPAKPGDICAQKTLDMLDAPLHRLASANLYVSVGRDLFHVEEKRGPQLRLDADMLESLVQLYNSLADANWELLMALQGKTGATTEQEREMVHLINYMLAKRQEKGIHAKLASLGAALLAELESSTLLIDLMLTHDSPGEGAVDAHDDVFGYMLRRAELKAREAAAVAKLYAGTVPLPARFHYLHGHHRRETNEGVSRKLRALKAYWTSAAISELTRHLAQATETPAK